MNRKRETNEVWGKEKRYCKKSDNNFYQSPLKTISKIAGIVRFILNEIQKYDKILCRF